MEQLSPLLQALIDHLGESAAVFVLAIFGMFYRRILNWHRDRSLKRFERGINQNVRLRELLAELRILYGADRTCIYQIHNGEYYHSGNSIMKCSLTHYTTKNAIAAPALTSNIPTTQMAATLKCLQDCDACILNHTSFTDDLMIDALFINTGIETVIATPIRDARRNWIGILCVAWIDTPPKIENEEIIKYSRSIGEFLTAKL